MRILIKNWKSFKDFLIVETFFFIFKVFMIVKILRSFFWGVFYLFQYFKIYIYYTATLFGIDSLQYIWIQYLWNNFLQHEYFKLKKN